MLVAAACAGAAATAAVVACIPDLPAGVGAADASEAAAPPQPRCGDRITQLALGEECDPGPLAPDAAPVNGCAANCKVACPSPGRFKWPGNNHCYSIDPQLARTETTAENRCPQGTHLVTFASEEEYQQVAASFDAGAFWVGLVQVPSRNNAYYATTTYEPGWAPTCPGCFAHTSDPTQALPGANADCVEAVADPDASWQQFPCGPDAGAGLAVICEREPSAGPQSQRCDGGVCIDLVRTFPSKHYVYVSAAKSGDDAEAYCESLGGTLVVLESRDEREQLWHELQRMAGTGTPGNLWIGLSRADGAAAEAFTWADDAGGDAYDPAWGDRQPGTGAGSRAYLSPSTTIPPPLDNTLAHDSIASLSTLPFVCQLPGADAGP